jgi:hypothetical protein
MKSDILKIRRLAQRVIKALDRLVARYGSHSPPVQQAPQAQQGSGGGLDAFLEELPPLDMKLR